MNQIYRRQAIKAIGAAGASASVAGCLHGDGDGGQAAAENGEDDGLPAPETPDVDTIAADPTDVPDPIDRDEAIRQEIHMQTEEYVAEVEDGVTTTFMTFEGQIPGPMVRVRRGDTIHLTFEVPAELNDHMHNVDFHATYGPGGGAVDTTLTPGDEQAEIEFRAEYPGAHIYHCAPGNHDQHISLGMFGTILVEPEDGLPDVDREFYVGQHELYTDGATGEEGHHSWDADSAASEDPTYVLFNGERNRWVDGGTEGPLHAEVGETVRLYWANGGPNHVSSPHPIGNVFKRWYDQGDAVSDPMRWVEGAALGSGFTGFGEMELPVPGPIHLVDHSLSRVVQNGLLATIDVEGEPDLDIYNPDPDGSGEAQGDGGY